jgi:hypothetical protein
VTCNSQGDTDYSAQRSPRRSEAGLNRNRILIAIVIIVLVFVAVVLVTALGLWMFTHVNPPATNLTTTNSISLRDVSLCASICIYPSPEFSATIFVNESVPLSTLHLFINGTDEGRTTVANATIGYATHLLYTTYGLAVKTKPNNPAMPIIAGKTYTITIEATFQDKSTSTASATVVASSGSGITTTNT